jgi:hypothetical protein
VKAGRRPWLLDRMWNVTERRQVSQDLEDLMKIKQWLVGGAMLAVAALPAASGVVANDLGPDNTQAKHVSSVTLADDAAMQQDGHPGFAARGSVLADAPRDPASGLPTGKRQMAPVVLAARGYTVLPRPGDPGPIDPTSRIAGLVFSGALAQFSYLDPCPCDNPVCRPVCRTPAGDPDDGGEAHIVLAMPAPDGTPIVRD